MWQPECCSAYGTTCCIVIIHCVSEKTRQFWQAKVSTSTEKFWYFYVYCISTFSKMISTFNFPCPFTFTYFITLFAFKYLRRKWRDTSDLKRRLIDTWASIRQNVIDEAVGQLRKRSYAWVKAKGHHFEQMINENWLSSKPPTVGNSIPRMSIRQDIHAVYRKKRVLFHVISVSAI